MFKKLMYLVVILPAIASAGVAIPDAIRPPAGQVAKLTVHAKGDQIYQCTLNGGVYSWQIQAPDAKLFDGQGQIVGNHYSGPVWEYKEGSRVVGRVVNKLDVDPALSISWLLVEVVSHKGNGMFSDVHFINRINTHGGLAPLSGCGSNHLGVEKRVAYTADYVFYTAHK
jgi:FtsP/CotA-like multicopper oxidase with cupredoxin domain